MCDVYEETCFSQKMFINELNVGLPLQAWVERQFMEWKHTGTLVKFWVQWSVKKVMLTVFWDMKRLIPIDFLEKGETVISVSYC